MRTTSHWVSVALALSACQPILIGAPREKGEGDGGEGARPGAVGGAFDSSRGGSRHGGAAGGTGGSSGAAPASGGATGSYDSAGAPGGEAGSADAGTGGEAGSAGVGGEGGGTSGEPHDPHPLHVKVLPVIYDPLMAKSGALGERLSSQLGVTAPELLVAELAQRLGAVTRGHVTIEPLAKLKALAFPPMADGQSYTPESYTACLGDPARCSHAAVDYVAIDSELGLCAAASQTNPDQIWVLGGTHFGFPIGGSIECQISQDNTFVSKTLDIVPLDFSRGLTSALTSYQAFALYALTDVFGVPSAYATSESPDNPWALFLQAQGRHIGFIAVSGCGDPTFAPNSLEPHRFDDPRVAPSYCASFLEQPRPDALSSLQLLDCRAWGCSERGFREYWLGHLPRAPWSDARDRWNDFWRYVVSRQERQSPPPSRSVSCSTELAAGWCAHVVDGNHEQCNEGEWATANQLKGFVELRFVPPRLVSGIEIYERDCSEQVLAGHVEFSDGSPDLSFGPVEDIEGAPTSLPFPPKLLSGFRVVIDEAVGGGSNAGFAEITYASVEP